jgi:hypothetical protein
MPPTPPVSLRLAFDASGNTAFQTEKPLSTGTDFISGLTHAAHTLAWLRFNRPLTRTTASLATGLPATL